MPEGWHRDFGKESVTAISNVSLYFTSANGRDINLDARGSLLLEGFKYPVIFTSGGLNLANGTFAARGYLAYPLGFIYSSANAYGNAVTGGYSWIGCAWFRGCEEGSGNLYTP